jgi:DNA-binding NtrC family response regulator
MGERAKILIVDDDKELLQIYYALLSSDYDVTTAQDGAEAIKKSNENVFNIALIDLFLPDVEGTFLLKKLRSGFPKLRKIIITGQATVENAILALNQGADAFILKPTSPEVLLKTIEEQLQGQQHDIVQIQQKLDDYFDDQLYKNKEIILADIIDRVDVAVEVWERKNENKFIYVYSNPATEKIMGVSVDQQRGRTIDEIYSQFPMQISKNY